MRGIPDGAFGQLSFYAPTVFHHVATIRDYTMGDGRDAKGLIQRMYMEFAVQLNHNNCL